MIKLQQLTKNYGFNPVLRGIDLHVKVGEFVALVGGNGAGKTTLLRIVATLLAPTSGQVVIGGWPLPQHAMRVRQHIGYVSHQSLLYDDLSAMENLAFFARLYGVEEAKITAVLKRVGLFARQRDPVRTFSRGMVQRLAIARATLHEPDILLLDEPYTGLDQEAAALLDSLLEQERELGRTIFMITHNLIHGFQLCDRIAILNRGKIVCEIKSNEVDEAAFLKIYKEHV
ncbi:MAG: heme ABC exporter ATP-binding protein CcmA [Chloroflexota bacterium]